MSYIGHAEVYCVWCSTLTGRKPFLRRGQFFCVSRCADEFDQYHAIARTFVADVEGNAVFLEP